MVSVGSNREDWNLPGHLKLLSPYFPSRHTLHSSPSKQTKTKTVVFSLISDVQCLMGKRPQFKRILHFACLWVQLGSGEQGAGEPQGRVTAKKRGNRRKSQVGREFEETDRIKSGEKQRGRKSPRRWQDWRGALQSRWLMRRHFRRFRFIVFSLKII